MHSLGTDFLSTGPRAVLTQTAFPHESRRYQTGSHTSSHTPTHVENELEPEKNVRRSHELGVSSVVTSRSARRGHSERK